MQQWLLMQCCCQGTKVTKTSLQITHDQGCIIINLDAKWSGSVHDSRFFHESTLFHRLWQGMATVHFILFVGYSKHFKMQIVINITFVPLIYRLQCGPAREWRGMPSMFSWWHHIWILNQDHRADCAAHNRTRCKTEKTFGLLKAHFPFLYHLRLAPDHANLCSIFIWITHLLPNILTFSVCNWCHERRPPAAATIVCFFLFHLLLVYVLFLCTFTICAWLIT